jgi:hypothetical protein
MIVSKNQLKSVIGFTYEEITTVIDEIDKYYFTFYKPKKDQLGNIKIKNGVVQKRPITPSINTLKTIQYRIQNRILGKIPLISNINGGVKGKNNIENGAVHKGKEFIFQTDIEKFFPSVSSKMVFNALRYKGFSKIIADLLSKLVTYETEDSYRNNCLPQGTHTSTLMANVVIEKTALRILEIIKNRNITFTLWVDDWAFSSNEDFQDLIQQIILEIGAAGFKVSRDKTTYRHKNALITGVIVGKSGTVKVSETFRDKGNLNLTPDQIRGRKQYKDNVYRIAKKKV